MDFFEFIIALVSVAGGFITVWIIILYQRKEKKVNRAATSEESYSLGELTGIAESLKDRIDTLESILDAEVPDWREHNERASQ